MGRAFTLLVLYAGLGLGGLWLADPSHRERLTGGLGQGHGEVLVRPTEPAAIERLVKRDLRHHTQSPGAAGGGLPPPGSFLDENGRPRLDPASFARFLEEASLLQERVDRHRRELDEKIRAVTR